MDVGELGDRERAHRDPILRPECRVERGHASAIAVERVPHAQEVGDRGDVVHAQDVRLAADGGDRAERAGQPLGRAGGR